MFAQDLSGLSTGLVDFGTRHGGCMGTRNVAYRHPDGDLYVVRALAVSLGGRAADLWCGLRASYQSAPVTAGSRRALKPCVAMPASSGGATRLQSCSSEVKAAVRHVPPPLALACAWNRPAASPVRMQFIWVGWRQRYAG